ncbi:hydantoinase/oxoprolinase N-terminal domain-containing protein [Variovorax sp. E3]|nr:hydantoinase/oxoprolinase N-terminal domain-containing protein [Variovorax sp. E3]
MDQGSFKIGIDVGGTFTDIVVQDASGALAQGKVRPYLETSPKP